MSRLVMYSLSVICSLLTFPIFPDVVQALARFNGDLVQFTQRMGRMPQETLASAALQWSSLHNEELDKLEKIMKGDIPRGGAEIRRRFDAIWEVYGKLLFFYYPGHDEKLVALLTQQELEAVIKRLHGLLITLREANKEAPKKPRESLFAEASTQSNREQYALAGVAEGYLADFLQEKEDILVKDLKKRSERL